LQDGAEGGTLAAGLRNGVLLIGTLAAAALLAGCGGSSTASDPSTSRFVEHGFQITFRYPTALKTADDLILHGTAGARDTARAGIGLDRDNVILVSRYDLRRPVTTANVGEVKPEVDRVIRSLAGRPVDGRAVDFGGLPGYAYRVPLGVPRGGVSRLFVLFDRQVEYFFNCQSTPASRAVLDGACDEALHTLARA
jgi:hypothetical protein